MPTEDEYDDEEELFEALDNPAQHPAKGELSGISVIEQGETVSSDLSPSPYALFPLPYDPRSMVRPVIACRFDGTFDVVLANGKILAVGANDYYGNKIKRINDMHNGFVAGHNGSFLKKDGTVVYWNENAIVKDWKHIIAVARCAGSVWGLRANGSIELLPNLEANERANEIAGWHDIVAIRGGSSDVLAGLTRDGRVVATLDSLYRDELTAQFHDITAIDVGSRMVVGLRKDGTVVTAGRALFPLIGQNPDVRGWRDIIAVAAGESHIVGLREDGTVIAAGRNKNGQCDVYDWKGIIAIAAGGNGTVGIRRDGKVLLAYKKAGFLDSKRPDVSSLNIFRSS